MSACVHFNKRILEDSITVLLAKYKILAVSYVHNCNKRSYYKFYSQGQVGGHFGLKSFIKEVDLRLLENFTTDFSSSNEGSEVKLLSLAFYIFFFRNSFWVLKMVITWEAPATFLPLHSFVYLIRDTVFALIFILTFTSTCLGILRCIFFFFWC